MQSSLQTAHCSDALLIAAEEGNPKTVKILLERGANIFHQNKVRR